MRSVLRFEAALTSISVQLGLLLILLSGGRAPAFAAETSWPQGAIRAALGRHPPALTAGGDVLIEAASSSALLVRLHDGGLCLLERPHDGLVSRCFEGSQASRQRDRMLREQLEALTVRMEDSRSRDLLHTLPPSEALRLLLGPACPPELCQRAVPDARVLDRFPRAEEGLSTFGDVLLAEDGTHLALALGEGQALLFRQGQSPSLVRSETLAKDSLKGTPYRVLSGPSRMDSSWQAAAVPLLERLEGQVPACRAGLTGCLGEAGAGGSSGPGQRGVAAAKTPAQRLARFTLQARASAATESTATESTATESAASGARSLLLVGPLIRITDWELSPSLHLSFGTRLLSGPDYAHLEQSGAQPLGGGVGVRLETFLRGLPRAPLTLGVELVGGVEGVHRSAMLGRTQSVSATVVGGLRWTRASLGIHLGMEQGRQVGTQLQPARWQPFQALTAGLELSLLLGGEE